MRINDNNILDLTSRLASSKIAADEAKIKEAKQRQQQENAAKTARRKSRLSIATDNNLAEDINQLEETEIAHEPVISYAISQKREEHQKRENLRKKKGLYAHLAQQALYFDEDDDYDDSFFQDLLRKYRRMDELCN